MKRTAALILAALALSGCGGQALPTDPDDRRFVEAMQAHDLDVEATRESTQRVAHAVCRSLEVGTPVSLVRAALLEEWTWDTDQTDAFIGSSVYAYCPDVAQ